MPAAMTYSRRPLVVAACIVVASSAVVLPMSADPLAASTSFVPAMLSVVACFDLMTVFLLVVSYAAHGEPRRLAMAAAYSWSLVVMIGYAFAFPGLVTADPLLDLSPSTSPYLYVTWHTGFPALLGLAWAPWPARWTARTPEAFRRAAAVGAICGGGVVGGAVVAGLVLFGGRLPALISGLDTSEMTSVTAPWAVPLVTLALAAAGSGTWRRPGTDRWTAIAVLVCWCDLVLTYFSGARYSVGWYWGRSMTLVAAGVVLFAMLSMFWRLKVRAEQLAVVDSLTGLANRRGVYGAIDLMMAQCARSGDILGVVSLDLDLFKQVNDRFGHDRGDAVLVEVGRVLDGACRRGDVAGRVGGEEFLILLPDADVRGTAIVAENLRAIVAELTVESVPVSITASFGVTALGPDDSCRSDLLTRVDGALYEAKSLGRNRVVVARMPASASAGGSGRR